MMSLIVTPHSITSGELDDEYPFILQAANNCGWGHSLHLTFEENVKVLDFNGKLCYLHRISSPHTEQTFGVAFLTFALFDALSINRMRFKTPLRTAVEQQLGYVKSAGGQIIEVDYHDERQVTIGYGNCNWNTILNNFSRLDAPLNPDLYLRRMLEDFLE